MLRYDEAEYRASAEAIREARPIAEEVADKISKQGYKNIFLSAVGGALAPMLAIGDIAKQFTTVPIFVEQAAELMARGNKNLSKDSVVITMSKSGDTKETVAMAKWCQEQGIRIICLTKNSESPLAKASSFHVPMRQVRGVEFEYILLYWTFFRLLNNAGDFEDYGEFADALCIVPENLIEIKKQFDPKAAQIAKEHYDAPIQYWIGGNEMWGETYLFSTCILEEMQWIKTKAISPAEFFHGTLELIEKQTSVFLVKGEGKGRVLDERAEKFLRAHTDRLVVIDTLEYALPGIKNKFRWLIAPLVCSTLLVDRLAANLEANTRHNLEYRRYYRQFDY